MIIVRLWGGLGNQMFEYAAGRRLAHKHKTQLKLDISWFTKHQSPNAPAVRWYELDCFRIQPKFADRSDLARIDVPPHSVKRRLYRKVAGKLELFRESETAEFYPEVLQAPPNSYLEGFWQSESYFSDVEKLIRDDFTFREPLTGSNLETANQIKKSSSVSLHIRRGDMASHPELNALHGLASMDYYKAAMKKIESKIKNVEYFIISDDPAWSKENLRPVKPTTYIDHNKKGADDMHLMSLCKHNIVANSSFSWWGAWLNQNPNKVVIAPRRWFNDPKMHSEHIIPDSWIKL